MIFITLGSQKFQFNRLLEKVDEMIERNIFHEEVFAQTGYSDYIPKHYVFKNFLDREEFASMQSKSSIVITHGGTGAIIGAVKQGKKVIAVPRLAKYGEHVDDHQLQIIEQFDEQNLIYGLKECNKLEEAYEYVLNNSFNQYISNTHRYLESISCFIES